MAEQENTQTQTAVETDASQSQGPATRGSRYDQRQQRGRGPRQGNRSRREDDDGFDSKMIKVRRVARMYKGGKRLRLSVFVAVGDRKGRVGLGIGKGQDVGQAQAKAVERAKKNLVFVPLKGNTIPHEITVKYKASRVMLKPAAPGTGLVAGSTVKAVLELAGIKDILTKVMGSTNQINAAYAAIEALSGLRGSNQ